MAIIQVKVFSAAQGRQLVRFAQPFADGFLPKGSELQVQCGGKKVTASHRVLTRYPKSGCARAALVTFLYDFVGMPVSVEMQATEEKKSVALPAQVEVTQEYIAVDSPESGEVRVRLTGPEIIGEPEAHTVEHNTHCLWKSFRFEGDQTSHIIDIRVFADGTVCLMRMFQRKDGMDGFSPAFGWETENVDAPDMEGRFDEDDYMILTGQRQIYFPLAHDQRAGTISLKNGRLCYSRVGEQEQVPLQPYAYRRAAMVVAPRSSTRLDNTLRFPIHVEGNEAAFLNLLGEYQLLVETQEGSVLRTAEESVRECALAIGIQSGHDLGNVTYLDVKEMRAQNDGINRMNHMADYFLLGLARGDDELLHTALLWADNYHDLTVWWGPRDYGGTRYPNAIRWGVKSQDEIPYYGSDYMWRSNEGDPWPIPTFSHKGFSHFFTAYEMTGDPYLLHALHAQTEYGMRSIHVEKGLIRNIGVARDFALLYEWTGEEKYHTKLLEMFEEYKCFINEDGLFSEQGGYVDGKEGFINDDATGYLHPFAKPYILGYGLEGLCSIRRVLGDIPGLDKAILDVARFIAKTLDRCGARRYPHPQSAWTVLALEVGQHFSWVLETVSNMPAADKELLLDAIEAMLRSALISVRELGVLGFSITSWEVASGRCSLADLYRIYNVPEDRDRERDFEEGELTFGANQAEDFLPYLQTLSCYSRYRSVDRLLQEPDGQFAQVERLMRIFAHKKSPLEKETPGVLRGPWVEKYPAFIRQLKKNMTFPLARRNQLDKPFDEWKILVQQKIKESYLFFAPTKEYAPMLIAQEDRGNYVAQKIILNISDYSRVEAYLLRPKGAGPFPGMLVLHDHGAKFDIGKEKMVRPFEVDERIAQSAQKWVEDCYDGSYIGDEMASRGYVCLCVDALNWSDRSVDREYLYSLPYIGEHGNHSHILDSNMQHLGASHAGWIAQEDMAAAEFLATLPYVDSNRIGAIGLSMGALRTWQVAAMSPHIRAGAAICWLSQVRWLIADGVNHAGGNENFMLHSGLYGKLDIPDFASVACPKPMLYFNGLRDELFPVPSVRGAYSILREVYKEVGVEDKLVTKLWDVPHIFSKPMQDEAFRWLDTQLKG